MALFTDFALLPSLQKTLDEKGLKTPTEIQERIIPLMLEGQSVVGISETGSGKTLAYALPLLHHLKSLENKYDAVLEDATPRAIIMVPTRELGEQIAKVLKTLTHDTRLRVRSALGGMAMEQARRNVSGPFEILLATPGRLVQLMKLQQIHLDDVRALIFDEADQMMDESFQSDSNLIAESCPDELQLGLFTATESPMIQELMESLFSEANVIRSSGSGKVVKTLVTKNVDVPDGKRWPHLEKLLAQPTKGGTLIFVNTRDQCDRVAKELTTHGHVCAIYRGEMDKNTRRQNVNHFRAGQIKLLVATDVAGRGLDIENVDRVINYHLPQEMDNYLHRVGRTARAGRSGLVVNFVTERDEPLIAKLEGRPPKVKLKAPEKTVVAERAAKPGAHRAAKSGPKPLARPSRKPAPQPRRKR